MIHASTAGNRVEHDVSVPAQQEVNLQIRQAEAEDRDAMLQIWLEASRVGHHFLGEQVLQEQLSVVREVYLTSADNWVAADDRIVGFIGLIDSFIGGLFVDPAVHERGIGKALIDHAGQRLGSLTVDVYEDNASALAFYWRCGFRLINRRAHDDEGRDFAVLKLFRQ